VTEQTPFLQLRKALVARAKHQYATRVVVTKRDCGVVLSVRGKGGTDLLTREVNFSWGEVAQLFAWGSPEEKREKFVESVLLEVLRATPHTAKGQQRD